MIEAVSLHTPPDAAELAQPQNARAWQAARDFEGMVLGQLLAPMLATVDSAHGAFGGGEAEAAWKPMLTDAVARQMAGGGGIGLAVPVYRQMILMQEQADQ